MKIPVEAYCPRQLAFVDDWGHSTKKWFVYYCRFKWFPQARKTYLPAYRLVLLLSQASWCSYLSHVRLFKRREQVTHTYLGLYLELLSPFFHFGQQDNFYIYPLWHFGTSHIITITWNCCRQWPSLPYTDTLVHQALARIPFSTSRSSRSHSKRAIPFPIISWKWYYEWNSNNELN